MSVLAVNHARVDPPAVLPVEYLSLTSLKLFCQCPEKWRRRYIDKEPEPIGGGLILGGAVHAALAQHYGFVLERGEGIGTEQLLDEFSAAWDNRLNDEDVDWREDSPGELKDSGAGALRVYHRQIAPAVAPVAVEREFELAWPGVDWKLTGFIDLETAGGAVCDYKATKRRMSQSDADGDLQADVYCTARRAEGDPATRFDFHTLVRNKTPIADIVTTERSERRLDGLTDRIFTIAREIDWRCETGTWSGAAPGTWFCSTCRYAGCTLRLGGRS